MFSEEIAGNAVKACLLEALSFPKPGNVTPFNEFEDLKHKDFVKAAKAIRKACELAARRGGEVKGGKRKARDAGLGELFFFAARDTMRKVRKKTNVNAGIILLLVPLCAAYGLVWERKWKSEREVKRAVEKIVSSASVDDVVLLFEALKMLKPRVKKSLKRGEVDLLDEESEKRLREKKVCLREVLQASFGFVPAELLNGFEKSFKIAGWLEEEEKKMKKKRESERKDCAGEAIGSASGVCNRKASERKIVAQVFLRALAEWRDSLVELKGGEKKAGEARGKAGEALKAGGVFSKEGMKEIMELDEWLRARRLNPGSTADLACAGIFIALMNGLKL
ncbi:triphosphoribosyl-dephospho-CoA synthase [Candidatus Micrarchaeota archaeon]|nr:triphosphoribosyl-dephospho-CoA synthase [Candidatus Micrarchaeota archaeon]